MLTSSNEVLAREGIDTMLSFYLLALLDYSSNEVLAREGIDTLLELHLRMLARYSL